MRNVIKKSFCVIMVIFFFGLQFNSDIYASQSRNSANSESLKIETSVVPQEAIDYAKDISTSLLANVVSHTDLYDVEINNFSDLTLGEPFTIESFDNNSNNIIYYFPILEGTDIKMILSVYKTSDKWDATLSKDIAEELNSLKNNDNPEYILNCENGSVYAENKTEKILIQDVKEINTTQNVLSYSQKVNSITDKGKNELEYADVYDTLSGTESVGKEALSEASNAKMALITEATTSIGAKSDTPFLIDTPTEKLLNVNYCLVYQQDADGNERGLCWAASVATIVRYMQGNPYLMAYNVADMMGIDYDTGATVYQMSDALFRYGLNFGVFNSQLNWNQVVSNINNKRPASMVLFTTIDGQRYGHAVTLIGYSSDSMALVYWNSGNHCIQISTHSFTTYIPYGGYSWLWENSLY